VSRARGLTEWVRVYHEAGGPLILRHGIAGDIEVRDERGHRLPWQQHAPGAATLHLQPGRAAVLARPGSTPALAARDVHATGS
jgi:hypothetical protein